jgi:hypothetical protein
MINTSPTRKRGFFLQQPRLRVLKLRFNTSPQRKQGKSSL